MNHIASNQHAIEEINGIRCGLVEKNVTPERAEFLKKLLEHNGYSVVIGNMPPPKVAAKPAAPVAPVTEGSAPTVTPPVIEAPPPPPPLLIIGVTDVTFNPMFSIYTRALKNPDGQIVSPDYWNQLEDKTPNGEWYWKRQPFK